MKLSRILALPAIALTFALTSCAGPAGYSYKNVVITLSYNPICSGVCLNANVFTPVPAATNPGDPIGPTGAIEMPEGGGSGSCLEITASITNAPANFTWTIVPAPDPTVPSAGTGTSYPPGQGGPDTGTLASPTGAQNFYCMPNAFPIYSGATLVAAQAAGLAQGETEIVVSAPADPNDPSKVATTTQTFVSQLAQLPTQSSDKKPIYVAINEAPSVIVPLKTQYQFHGYVVGSNGYVQPVAGGPVYPAQAQYWYVNNILNGSSTVGTITNTGLYTAPSAYPSGGKTVTISMGLQSYQPILTGTTGEGSSVTVTLP